MVYNLSRFLNGLLLIFILAISYFFDLDIFLINIFFFLMLYDLYKSKILTINLSQIKFLLPITFFISLYLLNLLFLLYLTLLVFVVLIIFLKSKITNYFFLYFLFLINIFVIEVINFDRLIFYQIIFLSFINDTMAFIIGKSLKGPLIIPSISPNKTWSGTISSFILSFIILFSLKFGFIYSFLISLSFFVGDIFFSLIKRRNNLKDFSNILGDHGGILDRFDSLFFPILLIYSINFL